MDAYVRDFASGKLTGQDLGKLMQDGVISKGERRAIQKQAAKLSGGSKQEPKNSESPEKACATKLEVSTPVGNTTGTDGNAQKESKESKDSRGTPSSKQLKNMTKLLNKELAGCALKKQLKEAKKKLKTAMKRGMQPDVHTYTNMVNCHVRCNDIQGAMHVVNVTMPSCTPPLQPNIVTLTTLLKGMCECGRMQDARALVFNHMLGSPFSSSPSSSLDDTGKTGKSGVGQKRSRENDSAKEKRKTKGKSGSNDSDSESESDSEQDVGGQVLVNARSVMTYLRGCVRTGSTKLGEELWTWLQNKVVQDSNKDSDVNSEQLQQLQQCLSDGYRSQLGALLCQTQEVEKAAKLAVSMGQSNISSKFDNGDFSNPLDQAALYVRLGQTCAILGRLVEASQWGRAARQHLDTQKGLGLLQKMKGGASSTNAQVQAQNSNKGKDNKELRHQSNDLFARHQSAELLSECNQLDNFVRIRMSGATVALQQYHKDKANGASNDRAHLGSVQTLLQQASQYLCFGYNHRGDLHSSFVRVKAAQITDAGDGEGAIKHSVSVSGSKRKADSGGVDVDVDGDVDGDGDSGKEKRKSQIQDRHQEIATSLLSACEEKLGLARLYRWLGGSGDETSSGTASSDEIKRIKTAFTQKMLKMVDPSNGRLDVRNLFSPLSAYGQEKRGAGWAGVEEDDAVAALPLPVLKIELGAGQGEWAVRQAAADWPEGGQGTSSSIGVGPRALWLALELRADRTFDALRRQVLSSGLAESQALTEGEEGEDRNNRNRKSYGNNRNKAAPPQNELGVKSNLAVISGDATHIMSTRVAPLSVGHIFSNHPEPPERAMTSDRLAKSDKNDKNDKGETSTSTSSNTDSDGSHLLTAPFLKTCLGALTKGGLLTIVTDSLPYARLLASSFAQLGSIVQGRASKHLHRAKKARTSDGADQGREEGGGEGVGEGEGEEPLAEGSKYAFRSVVLGDVEATDEEERWATELRVPVMEPGGAGANTQTQKQTSHKNNSKNGLGECVTVWRGEIGRKGFFALDSPTALRGINDVVASSSYFDRMWDKGEKKRRYFIHVEKVEI